MQPGRVDSRPALPASLGAGLGFVWIKAPGCAMHVCMNFRIDSWVGNGLSVRVAAGLLLTVGAVRGEDELWTEYQELIQNLVESGELSLPQCELMEQLLEYSDGLLA